MSQIYSNSTTPRSEVSITRKTVIQICDSVSITVEHIEKVGEGWDNALFKVNNKYLLRLPRRATADILIQNEIRFLQSHSSGLSIDTPTILFSGRPCEWFPFHWFLSQYIEGSPAVYAKPKAHQIPRYIQFLKTLHSFDSTNAPHNLHRSSGLEQRASDMSTKLSALKKVSNVVDERMTKVWIDALEAEQVTEQVIIHGDLHARNILIQDSHFSGIIDWGDVCAGDPATDLASIWMLFGESAEREKAIKLYDYDSELIKRAKGWATVFGVLLTCIGIKNKDAHEIIGRFTLHNLQNDHF